MLQSHKSGIIIDSPGSIYAWSRPGSVKAGTPVAHRVNGVFRPNLKTNLGLTHQEVDISYGSAIDDSSFRGYSALGNRHLLWTTFNLG